MTEEPKTTKRRTAKATPARRYRSRFHIYTQGDLALLVTAKKVEKTGENTVKVDDTISLAFPEKITGITQEIPVK